MSKIRSIRIQNYKGIEDLTLEIEGGKTHGRYITLVGLNESGKTSILEAISLSLLQDKDTADLLIETKSALSMNDMIPKHRSADFSDKVEITTTIDFSEHEHLDSEIKKIIAKHGLRLFSQIPVTVEITRSYEFVDSAFKSAGTQWGFRPKVSKSDVAAGNTLYSVSKTAWIECLEVMREYLPSAIYFPSFIVDFPTRVYLEGNHGKVDSYYRNILSDALNGLKSPLSLTRHVIDRVNKHRKGVPNFSSELRASSEGKAISAVVQKLAAELNFVIFGAWSEIFDRPVINRKISLEWHLDEQSGNHVYIEFYIEAGGLQFAVSERSLGFRWFFAFLLFTQFQGSRDKKRKLLFLFDEPASNLHPKAQERLLRSFEKISDPKHVIIYSTHSHYMINPIWLEKAYIVANSALDDESGYDEFDPEAKVSISAEKYRSFVSSHPSKTSYFQPVLDVLDHSSSGIDVSGRVVILEGKFDFYPFMYLVKQANKVENLKVMPAVGAGGLSALIGILRAWGIKFIIILDDDDAGRKEKAKYRKDLLLTSNQVVTLDELDPTLAQKEFEGIFLDDLRQAMISDGHAAGPEIKKGEFYSYFQALESKLIEKPDIPNTLKLFSNIVDEIEARLSSQ